MLVCLWDRGAMCCYVIVATVRVRCVYVVGLSPAWQYMYLPLFCLRPFALIHFGDLALMRPWFG